MYRVMVRRWPGPSYQQLDPYITIERRSFDAACSLARLFDQDKAEVVIQQKTELYGMVYWEQLPDVSWMEEEE